MTNVQESSFSFSSEGGRKNLIDTGTLVEFGALWFN